MTAPQFQSVASAPIFVITAPGANITKLSFQELSGINSEINIEQYVSVDPLGNVNHTKQMGLTKPPSVTLRKGLDSAKDLWNWHKKALTGDPTARSDVSLDIYGGGTASAKDAPRMAGFTLTNAWCAKITVSGAKAGEGMVTEEVTIACDQIIPD